MYVLGLWKGCGTHAKYENMYYIEKVFTHPVTLGYQSYSVTVQKV